jgi:hypothetical protein
MILHSELIGDTLLFDVLRALIMAPHPLLQFAVQFKGTLKSYQFNGSEIEMTDTGRTVLAGSADHIALNGIYRWIGGVHLSGREVPWRWDVRAPAIVSGRGRTAR